MWRARPIERGPMRKLLFGRYRRSWPARFLAAEARKILKAYDNVDYNMARNGEGRVLARVAAVEGGSGEAIFDVGVNEGEWARAARAHFPKAPIYGFELIPRIHQLLLERTTDLTGFTGESFGLSDSADEFEMWFDAAGLICPSMEEANPVGGRPERVRVKTETGDAYLAAKGIEKILMLKIDVEGAEMRVLKGFKRALAEGRIDVIQFEYNLASIAPRVLLKDFYEFLVPLGYEIGKVFPTYVEFRPYDLHHEDFRGPNFLAVRRARADLIGALS